MRATAAWLGMCLLGLVVAACGGSSRHGAADRATAAEAASTTATSRASYGDLVGAGIDLLRQRNDDAAEQVFSQAISKDPKLPSAYYDRGLAYQQAGRVVLAQRSYQQALSVDPRYVPALNNVAFLLKSRDPMLAIFYFARLNHLRPRAPPTLLNLGLLYAAQEGAPPPVAIKDLSTAVRLDPSLVGQIPRRWRRYLRTHTARR